jgi:nickel/cobalt transporter (NiCoT) family protein
MTLAVAMGLRHGLDPDHLSVIDGLSRLRPSRWNGPLFAVGHGLLVTLLAVGAGRMTAQFIGPYAPWLLILVGMVNLWRLMTPGTHPHSYFTQLTRLGPLLLGIVFGAGFETASQLSALVLAADMNPWVLGGSFSAGMILVDGVDGYLSSRMQISAMAGEDRAVWASRALGISVVVFSFALGGAELFELDVDRIALPLGCLLFVYVIGLRIWSLRAPRP